MTNYKTDNITNIWKLRADKLREICVLIHNDQLSQSLSWMADAYEQCYEEMENYNESGKANDKT